MPSDKRNSITAKATGLIFALLDVASSQDVPFLPTAAAPMFASWFNQSLPLFSFVLHSFLPYRIGAVAPHRGFMEDLVTAVSVSHAILCSVEC